MKQKNLTPIILILFIVLFFSVGQFGSGSTFKIPKYEKFLLQNGLTVYLMEQHKAPMIYISAVFPAGAVKDENKSGLASLTASSLMFGTKSYTKQQIEDKLDFLSANCYTYSELENARLYMSFLNTDLDTVLPIMKEIIVTPTFDKTEFEKKKKRLLLELEQEKESPAQVIDNYFNKFIFGSHVYGNSVSGTQSSVEKIQVEELKAFYQDNYKPEESAIAIVGDFDSSQMKAKIETLFQDWQVKGKSGAIDQNPLPLLNKSRVLLVNKDDATETRFIIGALGIKQNNPDYVAIQVINTLFGGRFTSWLNDELRVKNGLTYGAGSNFNCLNMAGTFGIRSFTRNENTIRAIDLTMEILDRLHKKGVDQELLNSAKNYIKGQYPPQYETSSQLAELLVMMYTYGLNDSFINDFQENVDSMTVEKANKIIAKYFPKDKLQVVLIGKASELRGKIKKYGQIFEKRNQSRRILKTSHKIQPGENNILSPGSTSKKK